MNVDILNQRVGTSFYDFRSLDIIIVIQKNKVWDLIN